MRVGVMITDGGAHPPELWAEVTADQLIDISAQAPETRVAEAREFRARIVSVLAGYHAEVQRIEREALDREGCARLMLAPEESMLLDGAVNELVDAARGYSFADHFKRPEVQDYVRAVLAGHFASSVHVERSLHADANPDDERAVAFRATHHPQEV